MSTVEQAVQAIRSGAPVILPTDTVYGLCGSAYGFDAAARIYALKGRPEGRPAALLASDLDMILECVPELRGRAATLARALLPGPLDECAHVLAASPDQLEALGYRNGQIELPSAAALKVITVVVGHAE